MSSDVSLYVHVWFHTNDNQPWISPEIEARLIPYMGGIARDLGSPLVHGSSTDDHVHLLLQLSPRTSLEDILRRIKGASSRWTGQMYPELRGSVWQHGYAAKSVSQSAVEATIIYIKNQRSHHGK